MDSEPSKSRPSAREHWAGMHTWQRALIVLGATFVVVVIVGFILVQLGNQANEQAQWERYFEGILEE